MKNKFPKIKLKNSDDEPEYTNDGFEQALKNFDSADNGVMQNEDAYNFFSIADSFLAALALSHIDKNPDTYEIEKEEEILKVLDDDIIIDSIISSIYNVIKFNNLENLEKEILEKYAKEIAEKTCLTIKEVLKIFPFD